MYKRIKELADEAIELQNKDRMDAVLREISARLGRMIEAEGNNFELAPLAGEVHGDPIIEPSPDADAYKAATEAAKSAKPAPAAKPAKKGGAK
jgi:hypothetical protein